jgi:hypothetical protein
LQWLPVAESPAFALLIFWLPRSSRPACLVGKLAFPARALDFYEDVPKQASFDRESMASFSRTADLTARWHYPFCAAIPPSPA